MSSKSNTDNRSNQLNPNNDAYYSSRGTARYDGDEDWSSGGGYYSPAHTYARSYSYHEFLVARVTVSGAVCQAKITVRGNETLRADDAAEFAFKAVSTSDSRYAELRGHDGKLLHQRRPSPLTLKSATRIGTLQLVERIRRAVAYRQQAEDARDELEESIKAARDAIREFLVKPPSDCCEEQWKQVRNSLGKLFAANGDVRSTDLRIANILLGELGKV